MLGENLAYRHAEEKVLADRRVRVEELRIEGLDEARLALLAQPFANGLAHGDEFSAELFVVRGPDLPKKAEPINILLEAKKREELQDPMIELDRILHAGRGEIEPVVTGSLERIAAALGLMAALRLLLG